MKLSVNDIYVDLDVAREKLSEAFNVLNANQHDPSYEQLHAAVGLAAARYADALWAPSIYELVRLHGLPNIAIAFCMQLDPAVYAAAYSAIADGREVEPRSMLEHCELLAQWCVQRAAYNALEEIVCSDGYNAIYH